MKCRFHQHAHLPFGNLKPTYFTAKLDLNSANRDDRIRTCGPFVPNEVRYQAALHPDRLTVEGEVAWNYCCQWAPEVLS